MPGPGRAGRLARTGITAVAVLAAGLLVFLPRLTDLGGYLIIDEPDRWRWAEDFFRALIAGDLRAMLVGDGYPGIVPVWVKTLWLLGESVRRSIAEGRWFGEESIYMLFHVWSRTEHLPLQRLPIALFNGLLTLLVAAYAGRLFGRRVGVLTLIFVALNPFYLADSRVNRAEAMITGLLTLSVLALIDHGRTHRLRPLIASGILGGLAFLTKIQGLVILPVVGATLWLMHLTPHSPLSTTWRGGWGVRLLFLAAIWLLAAAVTWLILWPAMWVRPLDVFSLVFDYATRKAGAEGVNVFFAGQHFFDADPGWLFYPVVALLRVTPLTMIGVLLLALEAVRQWRRVPGYADIFWRVRVAPLVIYVALYALAMSIGSHKQDRYLMPIFLALDILAALGWVALWDWLAGKRPRMRVRAVSGWVGVGALLAIQVATALPHHPYYFPYFNPLAGGGMVGARMLRVGWGEGMDRVAQYLNSKPNAASLTVAARWSGYMIDFAGKAIAFDQSGRWTRADYMVLYIQQTQRMLDPSPGVIRYFQRRQPEHVVTLSGIDYAQIYRSPFTRAAQPVLSRLPDQAALLGYRWEAETPGDVYLVWQNNRPDATPVALVVALSTGLTTGPWRPCVVAPGFEGAAVTPGEVVESECHLVAADDPPAEGAYDLRVGLMDTAGQVTEFLFPEAAQALVYQADGGWRPAGWQESLDLIARRDIPATTNTVDRYHAGQIRLSAYALNDTALQAGQALTVTLHWQALEPIYKDYVIYNHLFGLDGVEVGRADAPPPVATSHWLPGRVVSTTHVIPSNPALAVPTVAMLQVGLYDEGDRALPITDRQAQPVQIALTRVKYIPTHWPGQPPPVSVGVRFGEGLWLEGCSELPSTVRAGSALEVEIRLWWQATVPTEADYAVFVHLLDAADNIVAQADGVPVAGRYPTSVWAPGERIVDARALRLPADLLAGEYRVLVGLYNPSDGQRLPVTTTGADSYVLGRLHITMDGSDH
jgi:hypothetical protein